MEYCTPVQFAPSDDGLVIFVGNAETKTWWRNFTGPRGGDIRVLRRGRWEAHRARAVSTATEPEDAERLAASYVARYPRSQRIIDAAVGSGGAVFVHCGRNVEA